MIIIKQTIEDIENKAVIEISKQVSEFGNKIKSGTSNADDFMTIDDIENNWQELRNATEKTYTNMVSKMINAIDERDIVCKKKENTNPWG